MRKEKFKISQFFIFRNACYATNLSDAIKKYSMTWNEQRKETNGQTNRQREKREWSNAETEVVKL
jgi:hypothetical protein